MVYLDHNATTRPADEVVSAMHEALVECWHNPSSIHRPGQVARQKVELARKAAADLIGTRPRFITFTGTGTEAIDLAIRGHLLARGMVGRASAARSGSPCTILTAPTEHIAIRELAKALQREEGVHVLWAELDTQGRVSTESVKRLLDEHPDTALVSIQWANNETGLVQPVFEIGRLCRDRSITFHCDATQWVGKMPVNVSDSPVRLGADGDAGESVEPLQVDLLSFAPHKFHGPKGVGVLYARAGVRTAPLIHGEQELGRRGGTENVPGIVGAGVACRLAAQWLSDPANRRRGEALRDRLESAIIRAIPDARVNGVAVAAQSAGLATRLWNTSSIGFPRLEAEALLLLLSERGLCCSAGAACSSGSLEASPVLKAMKIPPEYAHGTLRFSISRESTEREVDEGVGLVVGCVKRLRESLPG